MKVKIPDNPRHQLSRALRAFSLTEVCVGMGVIGISALALFSGFTSGFFSMQMARENLRATQIMLEKTETIRLYSWDQVVNKPGFLPEKFQAVYDPNSTNSGVIYEGTVKYDERPPFATEYSDEMRKVTISLKWRTGSIERNRSFTTYIARNGVQNYVY